MSELIMEEKQLVKQLKQGSRRAVKAWFDQFHPELLRTVKQKVASDKDAEDIVQETMINCLKQIQLFREESSLKTWMMTIVRHEIADYYRKKYAKRAIKTFPLADYLLKDEIQDSTLVEQQVKQVLGKMLDRRKKILLMKYVDGLQVREIAKKMGKTFKAVEADLYRARENFKELYAVVEERGS